jgi:hypothetical protein
MRGTGTEKEVEICATNVTDKIKFMNTYSPMNPRTKTDPVSETSCFYTQQHLAMEKIQQCYVLYTIVRTL